MGEENGKREAGRADKVGKRERGKWGEGRIDRERKEGLKKYGEGRGCRLGGGLKGEEKQERV